MTSLFKSLTVLLALAGACLADEFTADTEHPPVDVFTGKKAELFRFSRSAKGNSRLAKYEQQTENDQANQYRVDSQSQNQNEQQQVVVANELPVFSSGGAKVTGEVMATKSQVVDSGQHQQQQQHQESSAPQPPSSSSSSSFASSSESAAAKKSALSKTITTTTTTTTTTTQNNQDQPQVAQIKEIRVHTVPLSEAVHYSNYMVVPTSSRAANLEESSSSSSSSSSQKTSSSSTTSETEQVAVAPAPTVVVNPPPAAVAPDCVLHRLVVERPVSSQLVVNVAPEVVSSHSSSSSSRSSKIVSRTSAVAPETTVYTVGRVFAPPVYSARVVQVPAAVPASREEHFRSESQSSRHESSGLGHSMSSSSSSSSSRTSKSSTTTTSQTSAALVAPPPPPPVVRTVTTVVRPSAPLVAVKAAPLVEVSSGRSNDVSVNVDHRQSGPNYNYGYSIKQHSHEPGTKGLVVGDRVVYL